MCQNKYSKYFWLKFWMCTFCPLSKKHNGKISCLTFSSFIHSSLLIGDLSASDTSLVDLVERHRGPLPQELMPLPSQGQERESPLEWTHLVDVASTFETDRNPHYGINKFY